MVIHSASDPRPKTTLCGDYFYNYFSRGLDILFDGQVCFFWCNSSLYILCFFLLNLGSLYMSSQTHKIKKFVLHTNFPGHSDFNTYIKCNFVIYDVNSEYLPWIFDLSYLSWKQYICTCIFSLQLKTLFKWGRLQKIALHQAQNGNKWR